MAEEYEVLERALDLLAEQRVAMMVTLDEGLPTARPMYMLPGDEDGTMWFFTERDSRKARHIRADPTVLLTFAGQDFLSVRGHATVVEDPRKAEALWSGPAADWFQCEPTDPRVMLIRVTPQRIAYWDRPTAVGTVIEKVAALLQGRRPELDRGLAQFAFPKHTPGEQS